MRARNIKPGFFTNDELAELTPFTRLLFIGMWCMADRVGRMKDRPKKIKAEILPFDHVDIEMKLEELARTGFISRYSVSGKKYIEISNFLKHQRPHPKELKSELPEKPTKEEPSSNLGAPQLQPRLEPSITKECDKRSDVRIVDCGLLIEDIRNVDSKPTTTTATEIIFANCFEERGERIRELYPHADFKAERETCIAHYRLSNPPIDCYPVVLKWFQRVPKGKGLALVSNSHAEAAQIIERNKAAGRESLERAIARGET
jgi:hypothetical protein